MNFFQLHPQLVLEDDDDDDDDDDDEFYMTERAFNVVLHQL